jgi:hypothetical protein
MRKGYHPITHTTLDGSYRVPEAFNDIERQAKQRQESVKANFLKPKSAQEFYDELRNGVIDEVAREVKRLTSFGKDTIDSLAVYIEGMKK